MLLVPLRVMFAVVRECVGVVGFLRFGVRGSSKLTDRVSFFFKGCQGPVHLRSTAESLCRAVLFLFELVRADIVSDIEDPENGS